MLPPSTSGRGQGEGHFRFVGNEAEGAHERASREAERTGQGASQTGISVLHFVPLFVNTPVRPGVGFSKKALHRLLFSDRVYASAMTKNPDFAGLDEMNRQQTCRAPRPDPSGLAEFSFLPCFGLGVFALKPAQSKIANQKPKMGEYTVHMPIEN